MNSSSTHQMVACCHIVLRTQAIEQFSFPRTLEEPSFGIATFFLNAEKSVKD